MVDLLHREIHVVITGNEFTEYNFLMFWLHLFPCFKGCFNTLQSLQDRYRVELLHREIPVVITGNGFAV